MTSICFMIPTWHSLANPFLHQPHWQLYYATVLQDYYKGQEISISVVDLRGISGDSLEKIIKQTPKYDAYLYWMFKTSDAMEEYTTAKLLKDKYPESVHIAGGTHAEVCPEECGKYFDTIIIGPGENSFVSAINDLRSGKLQKIYQQKWKDVPYRDTPFPRRDFLKEDQVVNYDLFKEYGGLKSTMVYFSRGCMYNCGFCTLNIPHQLQVRSYETMRDELHYLKSNYGVQALLLKDEVAIHPHPKISGDLFKALGEADLLWRGQTTSQASWEQLKMARETGCQELSVGVETVDDQVMKIINKQWQDEKQIRTFIENAKKLGIKVKMCIIFGLPGEPMDIVEKTKKFIEETEVDYLNVSGFCPLPGSPIYENWQNYDIKIIDHDWSKHAHLLYRYSDKEEVGLPFEYKEETRWGKSFTRDQIIENIKTTQRWLSERGMTY